MVLDSGDGVSHAVPVYNGFAIQNSIRRIDVAGRDVTENLQKHLRRAGYVFHTRAEKEVVRIMKEKISYVALDPHKEEKDFHSRAARTEEKRIEYPLPDGKKVKVSKKAK
jgi:centractin